MNNDDLKANSKRLEPGLAVGQMEHDDDSSETGCMPFSPERRKAIKLALSAAAILPGIGLACEQHGMVLHEKSLNAKLKTSVIDKSDDGQSAHELPNLTINININRPDLVDWLLLENLTESPLMIRQFSPRFVAYNANILDMNAMLARQQRGKNQLEIWPNHAWTHSVKGATSKRDIDQLIEYPNTLMVPNMPDNNSLQLSCVVDQAGIVNICDSLV